MIELNKKLYAESAVDYKLNPALYNGVIRRYPKKLEIYDNTLSLIATINHHGVIVGSKLIDGKKEHHFAWKEDPLFDVIGHIPGGIVSRDDIQRMYIQKQEQYIDTTKDDGMFKAFPNHEYRYR